GVSARRRRVAVCARSAGQTQLARAGRPGAVAAAVGVTELGRDRDLRLAALLVRVAGAAVRAPGAQAELEPTVVAVAGVDRPVAAGLALGEPVPHRVAAGVVGRGRGGGGRRLGADLHDLVDRLAADGA